MEAGHSDSVLQGEVLNALQSLHSLGAPPEARRLAGHWLLEFQASPSAWGVCHRLLQNGAAPAEYSLFAAQTLRRKIRCQLDTLPRALWPELRNALFVHVLTHRQGPLPVIAQLCLCLVSLAVIWEEWDDALRAVGDVLPPMAFLLFLEQVAEESVDGLWLQSSGVGSTQCWAGHVRQRIRGWSQPVLRWLSTTLRTAQANEIDKIARVLSCFGAWARFGALHCAPIDDYRMLAECSFDSLTSPEAQVRVSALETVTDIAECAPLELHSQLLEKILAVSHTAQQAVQLLEGDYATMLCSLFADFVLANLPSVTSLEQEGHLLRQALLDCISLSPPDGSLASIPVLEACTTVANVVASRGLRGVLHETNGTIIHHKLSIPELKVWFFKIIERTLPQVSKYCGYIGGRGCSRRAVDEGVGFTVMQDLQRHICEVVGLEVYLSYVVQFMRSQEGDKFCWCQRVESGLYCSAAVRNAVHQHPRGSY